jgi:hypothetical protein
MLSPLLNAVLAAVEQEHRAPTGLRHAPDPVPTALPHYRHWLAGAGVRQPVTDWSVADYRVARSLLQAGFCGEVVGAVLRGGSPGFPRRHPEPEDYLRRTVSKAAVTTTQWARAGARCVEFRPACKFSSDFEES